MNRASAIVVSVLLGSSLFGSSMAFAQGTGVTTRGSVGGSTSTNIGLGGTGNAVNPSSGGGMTR
jgi:hypothetical protein